VKKTCNGDGTKSVKTSIKSADQSMEWTMLVKHQANNRFDVMAEDGENIGWAYCYSMHQSKVCHLEINPKGGGHVEKTVHMSKFGVHTIGSMANQNDTITWNDHLQMVKNKDDKDSSSDLEENPFF
jgi:hypothetical protein